MTKTIKLKSLGLSGSQWIKRLEKKGFRVGGYAKQLLNSPDFKPSKKGTKYEVVVLKLEDITTDSYQTTQQIRDYAASKGYGVPNAEVACLLREVLDDKEIEALGLWWITIFHELIKDSGGDPRLLVVGRGVGGRWLDACYGGPGSRWGREVGFVFLAPQGTKSSSPKPSLEPLDLDLPDILTINNQVYEKRK